MPELAPRLDWNVQSDASSLDGASKDHVRRSFRAWVASEQAKAELPKDIDDSKKELLLIGNPRYNYCIHVDEASIDAVIKGPPPTERDAGQQAYINLVRADEAWQYPDFDRFDWSQRTLAPDEEEDPLDEREPEIEGCRLYDVGWMKASIDGLVPGVYATLTNNMSWNRLYCRLSDGVMES